MEEADEATSEVHFSRGQSLRVKGDAASIAAKLWPATESKGRNPAAGTALEHANGGRLFVNPDQVLYVSPVGSRGSRSH